MLLTPNKPTSRKQAELLAELIQDCSGLWPVGPLKTKPALRTIDSLIGRGYLYYVAGSKQPTCVSIAGYYALAAWYLLNEQPTNAQIILNLLPFRPVK